MEEQSQLTTVVFPFVNFALFLVALIYFARGPVRKVAKDQQEQYLKLIKESQTAKAGAEKAYAEVERRSENFNAEIEKLRRDRLRQADEDAKAIIESAERLAAHMTMEAQRLIEFEINSARRALREELVTIAVNKVSERISSQLNHDAHLRLVEKSIGDVAKVLNGNKL